MSFTNYLEEKLLDHAFRNISYSPPTTIYLALFTATPGEGDSGTEVSGVGYERQSVTLARAGSVLSNSVAVNFPAVTGDWGTVVSGGVFDAVTGGNLLARGQLASPRTPLDGDILTIPAGQFTVTLD
jgi:hypothetical protein